MTRRRLDAELVRRGISKSRRQAEVEIAAGRVTVGGAPALKPSRLVDASEPVVLSPNGDRYVSRGGHKLHAALETFSVDPKGRVALDAGASTGGFTDCLLQHGCQSVVAVDVGYGQLDARLREDGRVVCMERTNARYLQSSDVTARPDLVVGDMSFIGLATVLPGLLAVATSDAEFVLLVKPQFEAERSEVSRGRGVVRDPRIWQMVIEDVVAACSGLDLGIMGVMVSPLRGPDGNREFLIHGRVGANCEVSAPDIAAVVSMTVEQEASA